MAGLLLRLLITMVGLWLAEVLVGGVEIQGGTTFLLAALLLGIVNAFVRPVVILFTLPLTVLTLGLFLLIINAAMFGLVAALLAGFQVAGFWSALAGSLIVSIFSTVTSWTIGADGRYEILVVEHRDR